MFKSFFESIKYVGHLIPISFLRIFFGYYYLQGAWVKYTGDFLVRPRLADQLSFWVQTSQASGWLKSIVSTGVIPHWQGYSFVIIGIELCIGLSYFFGYVVRPTAILAAFFSGALLMFSQSQTFEFYRVLIAIHIVLAWVGAGRCLGIDYYFFKRRRGFWW